MGTADASILPYSFLPDTNVSDQEQNETPLGIAVHQDDLYAVRLLLQYLADPNLSTNPEKTRVIETAIKHGNLEIINLLLQNKAKLDRKSILLAFRAEGKRVLKLLADSGNAEA